MRILSRYLIVPETLLLIEKIIHLLKEMISARQTKEKSLESESEEMRILMSVLDVINKINALDQL